MHKTAPAGVCALTGALILHQMQLGERPMTYLPLIPLLVTAAPVVILGVVCLISGVETSIRENIGQ